MEARKQFWVWFAAAQYEFYDFENGPESTLHELHYHLGRVDPNLTFELGPKAAVRELVISAGGLMESFSSVVALIEEAPILPKWHLVAFRPRRPVPSIVELNGRIIDPKTVEFSLLNNGKKAGIHLFIPGYQQEGTDYTLKQIGYLMLDDLLGEFDVETRLGLIKMLPPESPEIFKRYPLQELPVLFDQLVNQLEGYSGKPS